MILEKLIADEYATDEISDNVLLEHPIIVCILVFVAVFSVSLLVKLFTWKSTPLKWTSQYIVPWG